MTSEINRLIEEEILRRFQAVENRHEINISTKDKVFLIYSTIRELNESVDKFIQGAVEHNDSPFTEISPDDQIKQLLQELTDAIKYTHGYFYAKASRSAAGK